MNTRAIIEVLTPRQDAADLDAELEGFGERYRAVVNEGYAVGVPDNPLGLLHFQAVEMISELDLPVKVDQLLIHLNTCHTRQHLDEILTKILEIGGRYVLAVTGDGSERLPKLTPDSIGFNGNSVTSVELLQYIHREYPGKFVTGAAFNPYEPQDHEIDKMQRKIGAGASFIVTQPIIGRHDALEKLRRFDIPIIVDAWMSKKIHLLSRCVGYEIPENTVYDPIANLKELRRNYRDFSVYLTLLGMKTQLPILKEILGS